MDIHIGQRRAARSAGQALQRPSLVPAESGSDPARPVQAPWLLGTVSFEVSLSAQALACPPVQVALTCLTWEMGTCPLGGRQRFLPLPHQGLLCTSSPAEVQLTLLSTGLALVASQSPLPSPTLPSLSLSPVFSFSSHKNVSAGPGLPSHPIVNNAALHLPTGQAQTCPRGSPLPPAGVLTHLFTFGAPPRTEQELLLSPGQCPLPSCPLPSLLCRVGGGLQPNSGASQVQFSSEGGLAPNTTKGKGCPWGLSDESCWTPLVSCPIELRARSGRSPLSKLVAFLMVSPVMFPAGSGEDTWVKEKL